MKPGDLPKIADALRRIEARITTEANRHHPHFDAPHDVYWPSDTLTVAAENVRKAIEQVEAVVKDDEAAEKMWGRRCSCRKN